jgi:DNA-binding NarL/FixJ family response regulator
VGGDERHQPRRTAAFSLHKEEERTMKIRVLVVDDFPLVREGLTASLEVDPDIEVVGEADDGEQGLRMALELRPDVVLTDMRMPGLGGPVLLARLREHLPDTRVLVVTASEKAETLLEAVSAGAAGYLTKRVSGRELRHAVITVHGGGSVITPALASHLLKEFSSSARGEQSPVRPLQGRELDVLRLVVQGKTDNEIGQELFISPRTVQNHLTRIREKTGLKRRSELTRWAVEHAIG